MPANSVHVGILGLGRVGASVGLSLRRYSARKDARQQFVVTGYDSRSDVLSTAQQRGALDQASRTPQDAAQGKDIVVIALPYADVEDTFRHIASVLRPDVVLLDVSPLKQASIEWAAQHLPERAHLVGLWPVMNPRYLFDGLDDTEHAAEDLFDGGAMLLTPNKTAITDAVELASDFSIILGSTPHFVDPAEHDGLIAATEGLPALLGIATFYMLRRRHGWNDARRTGNSALGQLTHHLRDTHPEDLRDLLLNNRENMLRSLDELLTVLDAFRDLLARSDRAGLEAAIIDSADAYADWLHKRTSGRWDDAAIPRDSGNDSLVSGLLGGFLARKLRGDNRN